MDSAHEDCFAVFLRDEHDRNPSPETAEYPLALCASYEEAQRVRHEHQQRDVECIIRFVGSSCGGD